MQTLPYPSLFGKGFSAPDKSPSASEEALTSKRDVCGRPDWSRLASVATTDGDGSEAAMAARWPAVFQGSHTCRLRRRHSEEEPVLSKQPPQTARHRQWAAHTALCVVSSPHWPHTLTDAHTHTSIHTERTADTDIQRRYGNMSHLATNFTMGWRRSAVEGTNEPGRVKRTERAGKWVARQGYLG